MRKYVPEGASREELARYRRELHGTPAARPGLSDPQLIRLGMGKETGLLEMAPHDRMQHTYVIGGTGEGKSTLLARMIGQDIKAGRGVCVLDPNIDLVWDVLHQIPPEREDDVVFLNPLAVDRPFGLNLYECGDLSNQLLFERTQDAAMHVYEKLWGPDGVKPAGWGARMENILRNATSTTIDAGLTMTELPELLENAEFRARVLPHIQHPAVRTWWERRYNQWDKRDRANWIEAVVNKTDAFVTRTTIRHIVGQAQSTLRVRELIDDGKILLVPLPGALLGEEVATLLGSMIVAQILTGVLSRMDTDRRDRRPYFLYADEFQYWASEDFARLIAEGRKFGVAVTMAHQFRDQLDYRTRMATLSVGNLIAFRVSGIDAQELALQYDNTPPPGDLVPEMNLGHTTGGHLVPRQVVLGWHDARSTYHWKEGPRRPYADMAGERANQLANATPYTAWVRLRKDISRYQDLLSTFSSPIDRGVSDVARARAERIIKNSLDHYGRDAAAVEYEIQDRYDRIMRPTLQPTDDFEVPTLRPSRNGQLATSTVATRRSVPL